MQILNHLAQCGLCVGHHMWVGIHCQPRQQLQCLHQQAVHGCGSPPAIAPDSRMAEGDGLWGQRAEHGQQPSRQRCEARVSELAAVTRKLPGCLLQLSPAKRNVRLHSVVSTWDNAVRTAVVRSRPPPEVQSRSVFVAISAVDSPHIMMTADVHKIKKLSVTVNTSASRGHARPQKKTRLPNNSRPNKSQERKTIKCSTPLRNRRR